MLKMLRNSVKSWVGIAILVLALGALVFTLFQPTGPTGGPTAAQLATVGGSAITEQDFLRAVDRAVTRERERQPTLTQAEFVGAGGGDLVLDQLIGSRAIAEWGKKHAMVIPDRMIDGEIASIPAFQVNGTFDEGAFRRLLQAQRISEAELRQSIAEDLMRRQLLSPVVMATAVPAGMAEPFATLLLEIRRGQILPVPSAAMPDPGTPTDAQLQAFHQENARAFTIPERRAWRAVYIEPALFRDRARPTEEQIRAEYRRRAAEFGGEELRDINFVVVPDRAKADAFVADARARGFAAAAQALGYTAEDIALGRRPKAAVADDTRPEVAEAAFQLKGPGITQPVPSPLGFYVAEVTAVIPPSPMPLDAVRGGIEKQLTDERVEALMADAVNDADEQLQGGASLAEVAARLGVAPVAVPPTTADGRQFDSELRMQRIADPLLAAAFAADEAAGPQVVPVERGHALLELTEVVEPTLVPLDRVRDDVAVAWVIDQRAKAARQAAEAIARAVAEGRTLAAAVAASGGPRLPAPQPIQVRRLELTQMMQQGQEVPPPVLLLLSTPAGQARVIPAPGGQGWFVVATEAVVPGNLAEAPELAMAVRQSFAQQAGEEMAATFVRAIERDLGVVRNPQAIAAAKKRVTGAGID